MTAVPAPGAFFGPPFEHLPEFLVALVLILALGYAVLRQRRGRHAAQRALEQERAAREQAEQLAAEAVRLREADTSGSHGRTNPGVDVSTDADDPGWRPISQVPQDQGPGDSGSGRYR